MDRYRKQIDTIDREIARLLDERLDVAGKIGRYKLERGLPVLDEEREKNKIRMFLDQFAPEKRACVSGVMDAVMAGSRKWQHEIMDTQKRTDWDYGLLGKVLGHSLSPQVHKALGGYEYGLIELDEKELDGFFSEFPLKGISVTIPYKRAVMEYCVHISETALACDSVNTVVRREDGTLAGYNTDYFGFKYMVDRSDVPIEGKKCLIFGSGGVSGTVKKVLEDRGAGEVLIISRKGPDNYENLDRHKDAEILVNATPLGMYPDNSTSPANVGKFARCCGVFDLIYNPLNTRLVLDAMDAGIPAFSGLEMLVAQAAYACKLFTGADVRDRIDDVCSMIRREQENIVLIGMPGSGKSSVGRKLAELTGKRFVDTDECVQETFGKTPEEIIVSEGEEEFRKKEKEVTETVSKKAGQIIATGGGIVETDENRLFLKGNGKVVCIQRPLEDLQTDGRPLSKTVGTEELYNRRKDRYDSWADITVENDDPDRAAEEIRAKLGY